MSPRALRIASIPFGLAAAVLNQLCGSRNWLSLFSYGIVVGLYGLLLWRTAGPRALRTDRHHRAFIAYGSPWSFGSLTIMVLYLGSLMFQGPLDGHDMPILVFSLSISSVYAIAAIGLAALDGPSVRLTLDGLVVRRTIRHRLTCWDDIAVDGATVIGSKRRRHMVVVLDGEDVGGHFSATSDFGLRRLFVDPDALARSINYYVEHPERRAAIGTPAELERLYKVLSKAPLEPAAWA